MGWEDRRLGRDAVSDSGFADSGFSGDVSPEAETVHFLSPVRGPRALPAPSLCLLYAHCSLRPELGPPSPHPHPPGPHIPGVPGSLLNFTFLPVCSLCLPLPYPLGTSR